MKNLKSAMAVSALAVACLTACGGGNNDITDAEGRLLNTVPASVLALHRGENLQDFASEVGFEQSSPYRDIIRDPITWSARGQAGTAPVAAAAELNPERGHRYSFVAYNDAASNRLALAVIDDPFNSYLFDENARVRIFNGTAANAAVDVYVVPEGTQINGRVPDGSAPLNTAFPRSGEKSLAFSAGNYRLVLTSAATRNVVFTGPLSLAKESDTLLVALPDTRTAGRLKVLAIGGNGDRNGKVEVIAGQ